MDNLSSIGGGLGKLLLELSTRQKAVLAVELERAVDDPPVPVPSEVHEWVGEGKTATARSEDRRRARRAVEKTLKASLGETATFSSEKDTQCLVSARRFTPMGEALYHALLSSLYQAARAATHLKQAEHPLEIRIRYRAGLWDSVVFPLATSTNVLSKDPDHGPLASARGIAIRYLGSGFPLTSAEERFDISFEYERLRTETEDLDQRQLWRDELILAYNAMYRSIRSATLSDVSHYVGVNRGPDFARLLQTFGYRESICRPRIEFQLIRHAWEYFYETDRSAVHITRSRLAYYQREKEKEKREKKEMRRILEIPNPTGNAIPRSVWMVCRKTDGMDQTKRDLIDAIKNWVWDHRESLRARRRA